MSTLQDLIKIQFQVESDIVTNGEEAIQKAMDRIQLAADLSEHSGYDQVISPVYKLIFMDCNMPIMDGFSATMAIK